MNKNLLLVHLESLNYNNFRLNQQLFPFLTNFEKQCIFFSNYYSTATSTLMVIGDLLYGGMDQFETSVTLDSVPGKYVYKSSLFDDLREGGYNTGIFVYPDGNNRESAEEKHLAGFRNSMILKRDYDDYLKSSAQIMDDQPFALMGCNYISNSSFNRYADSRLCSNSFDRWREGYLALDRQCSDLIKLLSDRDILDSTIIVFYGDHGDDYFTHGFKHGMTHAIEPNALLIHTPLFIFDPGVDEECLVQNKLIETTDLRDILYGAIKGEDWLAEWKMIEKKFTYSRSAYAAQPTGNRHYFKGYSVTNGEFLLYVTELGMEMYHIKMDSDCHNNLLKRFDYKEGILYDDFKDREYKEYSEWRWGIFGKESRDYIKQSFYKLKNELYKRTLRTYVAGGRDEMDMLKEMQFEKINR